MTSDRRIRQVVNIGVQKMLALRIIFHAILFVWSVCFVCLGLLVVTGEMQTDESLVRIRSVCFRAIGFSALIILPAIAYDSIRFSHRMAGPIVRLKNILPRIGVERLDHLQLRKNDFWKEFVDDVNTMLDRVEVLRQAVAAQHPSNDPTSLEASDACASGCGNADAVLCEASART